MKERPGISSPAISIIVPALNEEKLIERTLRCFPEEMRLRQRIELIVSDGGSHDSTVEIARQYADIVVEHTEPGRQTIGEGRNCGAAPATGELLVFINADTVPRDSETFVADLLLLLAEMKKDPRTVAIACPVEVDPAERKTSDRIFHTFFNTYVRGLNLVGLGMGRGECQVVRRDIFVSVGGYNKMLAAGEDFDLYTRLTKKGKIGHRENLCVYESPRRFRRYGYIRVLASWAANAVAVMVLRRSMSQEWEEIR